MGGNSYSTPGDYSVPSRRGNISIDVRVDNCRPEVDAKGFIKEVVDDADRRVFKLTESRLKDAVESYKGTRPTDAFLRSPTITPYSHDMYTKNNWNQVMRTLEPLETEIVKTYMEPIVITSKRLINTSSQRGTFNVGVTETKQNTVTNTWSVDQDLNVGASIDYNINTPGSANFSFKSSYSEHFQKSKAVTISSQSNVSVTLDPKRSVYVELRAVRHIMEVEVTYEASLSGSVTCYFADGYKGNNGWSFGVNKVLKAAGLPTTVESKEIVKVDYYTDGDIIMYDVNKRCRHGNGYCIQHGNYVDMEDYY